MGRNWHEGGAVGPEDGWVDGGHSSGSGWVGPEMGGGIGSGTSFGLFPASHRHSFVHLLFFCNLPQAHQLGNQENVWRSTHVLRNWYLSAMQYCNNTLPRGGMYWKIRPPRIERFAEAGILHPEAREIARGRSLRAISRAEGCKIPAEANLEVRGRRIFQFIPTRGSVLTFFFTEKYTP